MENNLRRSSVCSTQSQGNSSIADARCGANDTHAIVQREKDNQVLVVPLKSFINHGKVIKVGETATFKIHKESRADRGKIVLFGIYLIVQDFYKVFLFHL